MATRRKFTGEEDGQAMGAQGDQTHGNVGAQVGAPQVTPNPPNPELTAPIDPFLSGIEGRHGEAPRENALGPSTGGNDVTQRALGGGPGAAQATPPRPMSPTPMAGSSFDASQSGGPQGAALGAAGGSSSGVLPFSPLGSPDVASLTAPKLRSVYGSQGGLTGGGLGVPLDPTSNTPNDPINGLIQLLMKQGQ